MRAPAWAWAWAAVTAAALTLAAWGGAPAAALYVSYESHAGVNNQRQALEVALGVAACLGAGTRLAVHDWRRSVHSTGGGDPTASANATAAGRRDVAAAAALPPSAWSLRSDRTAMPLALLYDEAHLRAAARAANGVHAVPWRVVPPQARVLRLHMSPLCSYTCAWVRREVARACPAGADCALGPPPERGAAATAIDLEDVYSSVHHAGGAGAGDIYDEGAALEDTPATTSEAVEPGAAYYAAESAEHIVALPSGGAEVFGGDNFSDAAAAAAARLQATPAAAAADTGAPVLVMPTLDWGSVEALFAAPLAGAREGAPPANPLRPNARVAALVEALRALIGGSSTTAPYIAAHMRLGDLQPYALASCRAANADADAAAAERNLGRNATLPDQEPESKPEHGRLDFGRYVRVMTAHGIACRRAGYSGDAGFLGVADVVRALGHGRARGCAHLFVASNRPHDALVERMRAEARAANVTLSTLDDLVARADTATIQALAALERDSLDALAVRSLLDQLLCVGARTFVASSVSTWDQYVLRERATRALETTTVEDDAAAEALDDYALYVQHERAWLASYSCLNEVRPASALASVLVLMVAVVAASLLRGAHARLGVLEDEARRRARLARSAFFVHAAPRLAASGAAPVASPSLPRPLPDQNAALATSLALARFLVAAHGTVLLLVEPLAAAAQLGHRALAGQRVDVASVLSLLRGLLLVALAVLMVLDVGVRAARHRLLIVVVAAAGLVVLHAAAPDSATAERLAHAAAPLPAFFATCAFALALALVVAALAALAARSERRRAAAPRTSAERARAPPLIHAGALAAHAGALVLALALRACYLLPEWRADYWVDVARTVAEVACATLASHVLVGNGSAAAITVMLPTASMERGHGLVGGLGGDSLEGSDDDDADDDDANRDRAFFKAAEAASDRALEAARLANGRQAARPLPSAPLIATGVLGDND